MGGDFDASLILLSLSDGQFRQFVRGDYSAAVPARDILAFATRPLQPDFASCAK
jgi:hypothetical protein